MGMVIRVLYNNHDWQSRCEYPGKDDLCSPCLDPKVNIEGPKPDDKKCSGQCWEQDLRVNYEWGCTPEGRKFNTRKAGEGTSVFFVFRQLDGRYTLWAKTTVQSVNVKPIRKFMPNEGHYEYFMRFNPFEPLDRGKWVTNLTDIELVQAEWRMGRYRFITAAQEAELNKRIEGIIPEKSAQSFVAVPTPGSVALTVVVTRTMYGKLESAANEDGRQIDELVREAIAEWLKGRRG